MYGVYNLSAAPAKAGKEIDKRMHRCLFVKSIGKPIIIHVDWSMIYVMDACYVDQRPVYFVSL